MDLERFQDMEPSEKEEIMRFTVFYTDNMGNKYCRDGGQWYIMSEGTHMDMETGEYTDDDIVAIPSSVIDALVAAGVVSEV